MKADELRASILQAAIQGNLTRQDPSDEPASVLIERIRTEGDAQPGKGRGKKKEGRSLIFRRDGSWFETVDGGGERCIDDEIPFDIPETWCWARLESVCNLIVDCPHSTPKYLNHDTGFYAIDTNCFDKRGNIPQYRNLSEEEYRVRTSRTVPRSGDIVYSREGVVGYAAVLPGNRNICLGQRVMLFRPSKSIIPEWLRTVVSHDLFINILLEKSRGTGAKHVNVGDVKTLLIPIPPEKEQNSIMRLMDDLNPLIDQFSECHHQLTSLERNLRSQIIESIIQAAIQGNLTRQDPSDEPASVLIERIRTEGDAQPGKGRGKKKEGRSLIFRRDGSWFETVDGGGERCIDDEIPFDIPETWCWARLGRITDYGSNTSIGSAEIGSSAPVIELDCIEKDTGRLVKTTVASGNRSGTLHVFKAGDILYSKLRPYLNKVVIPDFDGYCTTEIVVLRAPDGMFNRYLQTYLMSPYFVNYATSKSYGVKMPRLGTKDGRMAIIAIPPLEEQRRIVAKLQQLEPLIRNLSS